jgi:hypothetical protein
MLSDLAQHNFLLSSIFALFSSVEKVVLAVKAYPSIR